MCIRDRAYTELLPADKVDRVEAMLKQTSEKGKLVFVGDGINDAPVLARADVGIAMGGLGSDAAIEAADVVLMTDEPSKISAVVRIARKTIRIANENIVFALGVKLLVLILGATGYADVYKRQLQTAGLPIQSDTKSGAKRDKSLSAPGVIVPSFPVVLGLLPALDFQRQFATLPEHSFGYEPA